MKINSPFSRQKLEDQFNIKLIHICLCVYVCVHINIYKLTANYIYTYVYKHA